MAIIAFPPVEQATEDGLLALGGDLEIPSLIMAYTRGIFPWPISEEFPLAWFSPDPRGVLFCKDLHIPRSLKKVLNKDEFEIKFNTNFEKVIHECSKSKNRKGPQSTWITPEIISAYIDLFYAGHAFSVEAYNKKNELVGGLYGFCYRGIVSGESMFYLEPNASKVALLKIMQHLEQFEISFLDTQMVTEVVEQLGGKEIPRNEFMNYIKRARVQVLKKPLFERPKPKFQ